MVPFAMLFTPAGLFYGVIMPLVILHAFTLIAIAGLHRPGIRLEELGKALFSYGAQSVAIVLMIGGGLPTLQSVLSGAPLSNGMYTSLLIIFTAGGVTYLWHDAVLQRIDIISKAIPHMIFACTWKLVGLILILVATVSGGMRALLEGMSQPPSWWLLHILLFAIGVLLTHMHIALSHGPAFHSQPMLAANVHKPAAAKSPKKAKRKR